MFSEELNMSEERQQKAKVEREWLGFQILLWISITALTGCTLGAASGWISISAEAVGCLGLLSVLMIGAAATRIYMLQRSRNGLEDSVVPDDKKLPPGY
ncbi:MAG TPA: hypothetical protein VF988_01460 [Verrucomicrobiae bacterium]